MMPAYGGASALRRTLAAVLLVVAAPASATLAQTDPGAANPMAPEAGAPGDTLRTEESRRERASATLNLRGGGIYDSNVNRSDEELDSPGIFGGAVVNVRPAGRLSGLAARYAGAKYHYFDADRWNRFSHDLRMSYEAPLADALRLDVSGWVFLRALTTEFRIADLYTLVAEVTTEPARGHTLTPFAAFRYKVYRDANGTSAVNPYAGIRHRRRWGSWHYLDSELRVEQNDAELNRRYFRAIAVETEYTRRITREGRFRIGLLFRAWDYPRRPVAEAPNAVETRRDYRWTPSVSWIHDIGERTRLYTQYRIDRRLSNDSTRDFTGHRVTVTAIYSIF